MIIFRYENSFEGLLTLVFESYRLNLFPDKIVSDNESQTMIFSDTVSIVADERKAERVWKKIIEKSSKESANMLQIVFLSEHPEAAGLIYDFCRLMVEKPYNIETDFSLEPVLKLSRLFNKVAAETARVRMFTRFQETSENTYYASFSPKYNVLPLCIQHFTDRFADQEWIIYDLKRNYGFYYNLIETVRITFEELPANPENGQIPESSKSADEQHFQKLWKKYYDSISIVQRKNYRLHRQRLPKRFWKYLPEKN